MIKLFKRALSVCMIASAVVSTSVAVAEQAPFKGNWTETFTLAGGNVVTHTPSSVILNRWMQGGQGINIYSPSLNGAPITPCGLCLKTDSTREEFIAALRCSGLY